MQSRRVPYAKAIHGRYRNLVTVGATVKEPAAWAAWDAGVGAVAAAGDVRSAGLAVGLTSPGGCRILGSPARAILAEQVGNKESVDHGSV